MQVRPEDVPIDRAFASVLAVVAEHGDVPLDGLPERFGLDLYQVLCDQALLPVLCAAHEDEIVILGLERIAELEAIDLKGDASSLTAALETKDVAAVAIDVHELRKQ